MKIENLIDKKLVFFFFEEVINWKRKILRAPFGARNGGGVEKSAVLTSLTSRPAIWNPGKCVVLGYRLRL